MIDESWTAAPGGERGNGWVADKPWVERTLIDHGKKLDRIERDIGILNVRLVKHGRAQGFETGKAKVIHSLVILLFAAMISGVVGWIATRHEPTEADFTRLLEKIENMRSRPHTAGDKK